MKGNDQETIRSYSQSDPDTKQESLTAKVESQEDSTFTTDGHQAILNKTNKKSKTNRNDEQWQL